MQHLLEQKYLSKITLRSTFRASMLQILWNVLLLMQLKVHKHLSVIPSSGTSDCLSPPVIRLMFSFLLYNFTLTSNTQQQAGEAFSFNK